MEGRGAFCIPHTDRPWRLGATTLNVGDYNSLAPVLCIYCTKKWRRARFLRLPLSSVRDSDALLVPPLYPSAQLRRVRYVDRDRLAPAIHSAIQIAAATIRSLGERAPGPVVPPSDGLMWWEQMERGGAAVTLDDILGSLWHTTQHSVPSVGNAARLRSPCVPIPGGRPLRRLRVDTCVSGWSRRPWFGGGLAAPRYHPPDYYSCAAT